MEDLKWINAEKDRPKDKQQIIVEGNLGLYWGIYETWRDGTVCIEGKYGRNADLVNWEDVFRWIPYPED